MIVTIHQPEHMPWPGFFHKMSQADVYVLLDSVQFKKNNWQNRNRIVTRKGEEQWLTVPVELKGHTDKTIREIRINDQQDWRRKYWGRINDSYCKHPYFKDYADDLSRIIHLGHARLCDLNCDLIDFFRSVLGVDNRLVWASELPVEGESTQLLISILKSLDARTYISGPDGANYLDLDAFAHEKIEVVFQRFSPPTYYARNGFRPGLSMLDMIMNHGASSGSIAGID